MNQPQSLASTNLSTPPKLHMVCNSQRRPSVILLGEGQMSDYKGAALMIGALPSAKTMFGDCDYDADWFRNAVIAKGSELASLQRSIARYASRMTARPTASAAESIT